jgi:DNA polymerase (family X)
MIIHNTEIVTIFNKLADLLEIEGANPFRVRAYRNAANSIQALPKNVTELLAGGKDLREIPGIGDAIAQKIETIIETGELPALKEIESRTPEVLSELMRIEGLGPKRVKTLYTKLKIKSFDALKIALAEGKVHELPRFGEKIEKKISEGLRHLEDYTKRVKLVDAMTVARSLTDYLQETKDVKKIAIAGSFRRHKETIGDLDILVAAKSGKNLKAISTQFINHEEVREIISKGITRSTVRLRSGLQVDLRVVPQVSFGAALLYFTGSKPHNIAIRKIAVAKKLKINEYGVFKGKKRIAGKTEQEVYHQIGLPYIEPELRENQGEIEAAQKGTLPKLINLTEIRGDLHCHTVSTDGVDTIERIAQAAEERGYDYIAITDHSKHLSVAHGLDEKSLLRQIKKIDRLNEKMRHITILKSIEVDILENGVLDLSNEILKELDFTVCSVHYKFDLPIEIQTERIIHAMDNPYFNIFAHPTGRLINKRKPYLIDLERIMAAAKVRGCFLEIDAQPERLDLNDIFCRMAKEMQLKVAISSDAHSMHQLDYMQFGVYQARRGWLSAGDVINTRKLSELKRLLKRY